MGMSPERTACIQMTLEYDRISQSFNSMTFFFIFKQLYDFQLINLDSHSFYAVIVCYHLMQRYKSQKCPIRLIQIIFLCIWGRTLRENRPLWNFKFWKKSYKGIVKVSFQN